MFMQNLIAYVIHNRIYFPFFADTLSIQTYDVLIFRIMITNIYCDITPVTGLLLIPSIIISNIIMQAAIPFVFGDEVNGLHLIFGGGGKGIKMNLIAAILILYFIILTPLALLYRKYKKVYFWSMFIVFIMSYMLPIIFMYGVITKITLVLVTVFWSIFAIITANKGLRKVELE